MLRCLKNTNLVSRISPHKLKIQLSQGVIISKFKFKDKTEKFQHGVCQFYVASEMLKQYHSI